MVNDRVIPTDAMLNPYTLLAFLPPEFADNLEIIRYVHAATLAVSLLIQCNVKKLILGLLACRLTRGIVRDAGITAPNIAYFLLKTMLLVGLKLYNLLHLRYNPHLPRHRHHLASRSIVNH